MQSSAGVRGSMAELSVSVWPFRHRPVAKGGARVGYSCRGHKMYGLECTSLSGDTWHFTLRYLGSMPRQGGFLLRKTADDSFKQQARGFCPCSSRVATETLVLVSAQFVQWGLYDRHLGHSLVVESRSGVTIIRGVGHNPPTALDSNRSWPAVFRMAVHTDTSHLNLGTP